MRRLLALGTSLLLLTLASPRLLADGAREQLFLEGSLQIGFSGLAQVDEEPEGRDLVAKSVLEVAFITSDENTIRLAEIPIEIRMPIFGQRDARAIKGAKLGIVSALVNFEDQGFPLEALPEGFKVLGYRHERPPGARAAQLMEKLYSRIKEQRFKTPDDFEDEKKPTTEKGVQIKNGVALRIAFDSASKLRDIEVRPPDVSIEIELPLPEAARNAQELARANLESQTVESLTKIQQRLALLTSRLKNSRYELQRVGLIAEEAGLKLDLFREAALIEYHTDLANKEAGLPAAKPSYWKNKARLDELQRIVDRLQLIRDRSVSLVCSSQLLNR